MAIKKVRTWPCRIGMQQNHTYIKLVDVKRDNEYCTQSYTIKAWLQFGQCMDDERNDVAHSQQANEYYNRALFSCLRKLWVEHVDGGTCYGNLGVVHCLLAALNQAKGCQDGTLIIRVKNLGIEVIQIMHSKYFPTLEHWLCTVTWVTESKTKRLWRHSSWKSRTWLCWHHT